MKKQTFHGLALFVAMYFTIFVANFNGNVHPRPLNMSRQNR